MDVVDWGSIVGGKTVDAVPAAYKPTADVQGDNGVKAQNGSNGTLEIDAPNSDTLIQVTQSASTSCTVRVTDDSDNIAYSRFGSGVTNLNFKTNNAADQYYPNGGTQIEVATNVSEGLPGLNPNTHLTVDTGTGTHDTVRLGGPALGESVTDAKVITGAGDDRVIIYSDDDDASTERGLRRRHGQR